MPCQVLHGLSPGKSLASSTTVLHAQAAPGLNQESSHLRAFALAVPSARSSLSSDCTRCAHLLQMFAPLRKSKHSVGYSI